MPGALVQQTHSRVGGATFLTITLNGVAAGAFLALFVGTWNHGTPPGTVTGGGATWTRRINQGQATSFTGIELWEGLNATGGTTGITWTRGAGSPDIALLLTEWSSMPTSAAFDVAAATAYGSTLSPDSGATAATAQADSVAVSVLAYDGSTTTVVVRAGDGYTDLVGEYDGNNGAVVAAGYKVLSATGAQSGRFTLGALRAGDAGVAVYAAAVGGGAQDTPELRGRPAGLRGHRQMHQLLAQ